MRKNIIAILTAALCAFGMSALVACQPADSDTPNPPPPDMTEHVHNYVPTVTAPQCFAQGYTTYACSCGANYIDDYTDAVGHSMDGDRCARCGHEATSGLTFEAVNGGYEVTGIGTATTADLIIPSKYNGSDVVAIADNAFRYVDFIEYVTLPESVKVIGREAFFGCDSLKGVALTAVEEIGTLALSSENVKKVELPDTLKIIRDTAFGQLVTDEIKIPASVELIEECAFAFCEFDKITVESGNARYSSAGNCLIDTQTGAIIAGCKGSVIPADGSVTKIADKAFTGLIGKDELVIPDAITYIGLHAFSESEIKSLKIGKGVNSIMYGAFRGCENLVTVTVDPLNERYMASCNCIIDKSKKSVVLGCKGSVIPTDANIVTAVAENAFREAPIPASFVIPSNITSIGLNAFAYSGLESITIGAGLTDVSGAFSNCKSLKNVTVSDGATNIAADMFRNCGAERITLPESITEIGESAFAACSSLREINIPSKVTAIPNSAFDSCVSLVRIVIPDSVETIGENAFANCYNLVKVTIGAGVTSIGNRAFNNCNKLTEVVNLSSLDIQKSTSKQSSVFGNIGYSVATTKFQAASLDCYFAGEIYTSTDYTSKLDFVDGFVFYNNGGSWELYGCNNVGDVTLPTSYKGNDYDIASGAFAYYTSATGVKIESGVRKIKMYAFFNNRDIETVDISGVAETDYYVFQQCTKLKNLTFKDCGTIAAYTVVYCGAIEQINIHNVGTVGQCAFVPGTAYNSGESNVLARITVTGKCDLIDGWAFCNYTNRNAVVILSADIKKIAAFGFYNCGFDTVYFTGTREQWTSMNIEYASEDEAAWNALNTAAVYCYSESRPTGDGNYWHYGSDGVTPVKW